MKFDKTMMRTLSLEVVEEIKSEYLDSILTLKDIFKCATKAQLSLAILERLYAENAKSYEEVITKEEVMAFSKDLLNSTGERLADTLKNMELSDKINKKSQEK